MYETERQRAAVPMLATCDAINRIYSNQNPLLVLLRSIGCQTLHTLTPVKVSAHYVKRFRVR